MKTFYGAVLASLLLLGACGGDSHHAHDSHEAAMPDPEPAESGSDAQASGSLPVLALNGDAKWTMDDHTRTMFTAMTARVSADTDAGVDLGKLLQADVQSLIAGCTMHGEAHDELHKYLMTLLPAVNSLAETGNQEAAQTVQDHLELYPRYFE